MRQFGFGCAMAAVALCANAAVAQGVAQHAYDQSNLSGWSGSPDTLIRMIHRIERTTGGRVLEIRYTDRDGMPGFRAAVAEGNRVAFLRVAAQDGDSVEISEASLPDWMLKWRTRTDVAAVEHATVPLSQAIRTAEQADGGAPAVAAGIAGSAANPTSDVEAYNVLVDRKGDVRRIAVDDQTGQVIANPRALASWP